MAAVSLNQAHSQLTGTPSQVQRESAPPTLALTGTAVSSKCKISSLRSLAPPPLKNASLAIKKKRKPKQRLASNGTQADSAKQLGIRAFLSSQNNGPMGMGASTQPRL